MTIDKNVVGHNAQSASKPLGGSEAPKLNTSKWEQAFNNMFSTQGLKVSTEEALSLGLYDRFNNLFWATVISSFISYFTRQDIPVATWVAVFYYGIELALSFIFIVKNIGILKKYYKDNEILTGLTIAILAMALLPLPVLFAFSAPTWLIILSMITSGTLLILAMGSLVKWWKKLP